MTPPMTFASFYGSDFARRPLARITAHAPVLSLAVDFTSTLYGMVLKARGERVKISMGEEIRVRQPFFCVVEV